MGQNNKAFYSIWATGMDPRTDLHVGKNTHAYTLKVKYLKSSGGWKLQAGKLT